MSLEIIKNGLLDTVQDNGRYGYGHLGINPGGAMDVFSAALANCVLGNEAELPVIELYFPAPQVRFNHPALICISGAHFSPVLNGVPIPLHTPIAVQKDAVLSFEKWVSGNCCYLALANGLELKPWLGSYSTNLKAAAGGWEGRALRKGDVIPFKKDLSLAHLLLDKLFVPLPWSAKNLFEQSETIFFIKGSEWDWLTPAAQQTFVQTAFTIALQADRMGYRLQSKTLEVNRQEQLVSAGVAFGTVQLLPNGQTIVLMADHQTTGGYPKIAQVISAHLPLLAQLRPGAAVMFRETDLPTAERLLVEQQKYLQQIRNGSTFNLEKMLYAAL